MSRSPIPITILTGFVGSGKTTLLLSLLPQLRRLTPSYRLALIKNEIGDLAIDTALAASAELASSRELLGSCICCTNVGQLGSALEELAKDEPDRIVIETSGSAEPIKLVLEINRLGKETGRYALDGVVGVVDVREWQGYGSTSYTAKLQAKQTDLIVLNKWEDAGEERLDKALDMLGEMDVDTPHIKSDRGRVNVELLFGLDGKMVRGTFESDGYEENGRHHHDELECLHVTLDSESAVDLRKLDDLLKKAPKDEVYRIKGLLKSKKPPIGYEGDQQEGAATYILNGSFGRHTWTRHTATSSEEQVPQLRLSLFLAPYESTKWTKRLESGQYISTVDDAKMDLVVKRVL